MTRDEFSKLFALLRGAFPQQVVTLETAEAYYALLGRHDYQTAHEGFIRVLSTATFWPSPGVIASNIAEAQAFLPDAPSICDEIWSAVSSRGLSAGPGDLSPVAAYTVRCLGWRALCDTTSESRMAMNAHMLKVAATYRQRAIEESAFQIAGVAKMAPLPSGMSEGLTHIRELLPSVAGKSATQMAEAQR